MADGGINFEIRMEDAKLIAGLLRAVGAQKQFTSEVDKTAAASRKADKELDRMAESVKKMTATPLEKYNAELNKLNTLQARGKITAEQHSRAVTTLNASYAQLGQATVATGKVGTSSAMQMAQSLGVVTTAAGAAMVGINLLKSAFQRTMDEVKEAKDLLEGLQDPRLELNQTSPDQATFDARIKRIAEATKKHGGTEAYNTRVYNKLVGAKAEEHFETVLAAKVGQLQPLAAAEVIGGLTTAFPGKISGQDSLDVMQYAGKEADATPEELSRYMNVAAQGTRTHGGTAAQAIGTYVGLANLWRDPGMAANRMRAFGALARQDKRLHGMSQVEMAEFMRDKMTAEERETLLGKDLEKNEAYDELLRNGEEIRRITAGAQAAIDAPDGEGLGVEKSKQWMGNPETRAVHEADVAKGRREVEQRQHLGEFGTKAATGLDAVNARNYRLKRGALHRAASYSAAWLSSWFASPETVEAVGDWAGRSSNDVRVQLRETLQNTRADVRAGRMRNITPPANAAGAGADQNVAEMHKQAATLLLQAAQQLAAHTKNMNHRAANLEALQVIG